VPATLQAAIDKINSLPAVPDLIIHTGDLTQISKPGEFDTVDQVLRGAKAKQVFYVPGEHDFAVDTVSSFSSATGKIRKELDGKASITKVFTLSASTMRRI
jgi:3',5'-cyclic-AMP phosphodiesterase